MATDRLVVTLVGGLGNQLFQFAAAKGLQGGPDRPVVVDAERNPLWPNVLGTVLRPGTFRPVSNRELLSLGEVPVVARGQQTAMRGRDALGRFGPRRGLDRHRFVERTELGFDPAMRSCSAPVLLRGYFQSEEYFAHVADAVRRAFRPPGAEATRGWRRVRAALPDDRPWVGVSLRTAADYQQFTVVLPRSYYRQAVDLICRHQGASAFVVFGDVRADADAAAAWLARWGPAVSVADLDPPGQLHLMARLAHLVVANSSFAWWGGWLGDQAAGPVARLVVAPEPWSVVPGRVVPDRWTTIAHEGLAPGSPWACSR